MGRAANGRVITVTGSFAFRGQVAFSSPLKALGKSDVMHNGQAL